LKRGIALIASAALYTRTRGITMTASSSSADYYKLNVGGLPDSLFKSQVPVEKWLETATTAGASGFPPNSLNQLTPLDREVEMERIVGISLYMIGNVLPFLLPILGIAALFSSMAQYLLMFLLCYVAILFVIENYYFKPRFSKRYNQSNASFTKSVKDNQYLFTERHTTKYLSMHFVWPKSIQRPKLEKTPVIFCVVPHAVGPFGITAYPMWSKLFNDKLCHWTAAPVVLKLPIVSFFLKQIGYINAKSKDILETLTKKEENVGIILDGIAGMFHQSQTEEMAYLQSRKAIVKVALRAGAPLVPVYGFGHTSLYTVVVDPFGILEYLSNTLDTALTPFFGRFGWFLGPPRRLAVTVCLGEPVLCPQIDEPTNEEINKYHQQMLDSFKQVFDQHKGAYGWPDKKLKFV
jgi:hypothetical protein